MARKRKDNVPEKNPQILDTIKIKTGSGDYEIPVEDVEAIILEQDKMILTIKNSDATIYGYDLENGKELRDMAQRETGLDELEKDTINVRNPYIRRRLLRPNTPLGKIIMGLCFESLGREKTFALVGADFAGYEMIFTPSEAEIYIKCFERALDIYELKKRR